MIVLIKTKAGRPEPCSANWVPGDLIAIEVNSGLDITSTLRGLAFARSDGGRAFVNFSDIAKIRIVGAPDSTFPKGGS